MSSFYNIGDRVKIRVSNPSGSSAEAGDEGIIQDCVKALSGRVVFYVKMDKSPKGWVGGITPTWGLTVDDIIPINDVEVTPSAVRVKVQRLYDDAVLPSYAKPGDAGMDLTACDNGTEVEDRNGSRYIEYKTGLAFEIPEGYVGLIFPRSSISKTSLSLSNAVGVIDSGYRGEVGFRFRIDGPSAELSYQVKSYAKGDRIGQMIVVPFPRVTIEEVSELSDSVRGTGGFGSSGA